MQKLILFVLLLFLAFSCKKDDGPPSTQSPPVSGVQNPGEGQNPDGATFEIVVESKDIQAFQIITLGIPTIISLTEDTYKGNFNGSEIALAKNEDGTKISFMAPNLVSGNYTFTVILDEKQGQVDFALAAIEDVPNVADFLTSEVLEPITDALVSIESTPVEGTETDETNALLDQANEYHDKFLVAYQNLSEEEKQLMANFMSVNGLSLVGDGNDSMAGRSIFDMQKLDLYSISLVQAKIRLIASIASFTAAIYIPEGFSKVFALGVAVYGITQLWHVLTIRQAIVDLIFLPIENLITQLSGKSASGLPESSIEVIDDKAINVTVTSKARKVQKNDTGNLNQNVATAASEINDADERQNELKRKVDYLVNLVGTFFGLNENRIRETTGLPEQAAEEIITVAYENFFIEGQPTNISVSVEVLNTNTLQLKFTSQSGEATQFTAQFIYDDGDFRTETALNVNLEKKEENNEVDLEGSWDFYWENIATGSYTVYDSQGEVAYVVADPVGDFLYNVRFDSNGELIVALDPEIATYSNSSGLLTINVTYDRSNYIQIFSFSGTWNEQQSAFIGSGTVNYTQWASNERIRKSSEGYANYPQLFLFK